MLNPFQSLLNRTITDGPKTSKTPREPELDDRLIAMGMAETIKTVDVVNHVTSK